MANRNLIPVEALMRDAKAHQRRYWRTPAELEEHGAEDPFAHEVSESSRRRFLTLMAGSMALAGLTGCTRQPVETIMPYVDPPEDVIPGRPKYYATAAPVNGIAEGVIVESHTGRPTKVEGNPDHPASLGSTCVLSQACLMDLYDPDRSKDITYLGAPQSWEAFQTAWISTIDPLIPRHGDGFRILTETVTSPSLAAQIQAVLRKFPAAKWHQFDPAGPHSARAAAQTIFGRPVNTCYKLDSADIVVALDSDFLASGPGSTRYARDFSTRRKRGGNRLDMNRLYAIESAMTPTGGKADHRLAMRYADIDGFARALAAAVGAAGINAPGNVPHADWLNALAQDLLAHKGATVIIPGDYQTPAIHALAHAMNAALGNVGKTVIYTDPVEVSPIDQLASLRELCDDMHAGKVDLLLILGGNPVYNAPMDFRFADALQKVKDSIHVALHFDETSLKTTWHIPEPHFLEDWGDTRAFDGTVSIIQPLIAPLYNSHSFLKVLDATLQLPGRSSYEIVRAYWSGKSGASDFEQWWRKSVHDGLIAGSALPAITPNLNTAAIPPAPQASANGLEITFRPDVYLYDGRYANNVWLQELPHPMTKLAWDNAVLLSPNTARRLHMDNQQHVQVRFGNRFVEGSVWIQPGHPDGTVGIDLGWGRWQSGRAGNGAGFNAYAIRTSDALWTGTGVELRKLSKPYPLATTQMQKTMADRDVVIWNTLEGYKQNPNFAQQKEHEPPENLTLYPHWDYRGYAWAMSIDLTACVNCQACVIACQAENNIAVVGKEQVLARRAMHWLRIDTYFEEDWNAPSVYYIPIPCMQCENAPCELVCPVQATNHSRDGLNDMVYNRCIGTRYCSNNCPWKVRRFNFLLFQDWTDETWKLQRNPDVTVRSRGVMEKCTYCVQRIREAEIRSQDEGRFIRDGEIQTACQQACPTQAIVFGDKNNPDNRVAQLKAENLNYAMYSELNTRPRTSYLAELKNLNPGLKGGTSA
ncbi:MAG TPA: molybdopterin oxidoreductase [Bryobacteraceae bacterium]|jgi:molybdopterin-containing oxidoreductase family iron-sulfur binding subunit|nr:molybdopterin oxidoreductase [Bryobacteraceae bacterium]